MTLIQKPKNNLLRSLYEQFTNSLNEFKDDFLDDEDIEKKVEELVEITKFVIEDELRADSCRHEPYDTIPEQWYKNGMQDGLQQLITKIRKKK